MRIIIKEDSSETVLCDGPEKGTNRWMGPDGIVFDGQVNAQVQPFMRAASVKVYNRNNHRIAVQFKCRRDCGSIAAAEAFIIKFYATCKRGTEVTFSTPTDAGTANIRINNAVLQSIKLSHVGVLVLGEFSIVGGSLS